MSDKANTILKEAYKLYKQNEYTNVITKCKKIIKEDGNNYKAFMLLAASMNKIEEFQFKVPEILERAIKIEPDNLIAWKYLVQYYEQHSSNIDNYSNLMLAYCKVLQFDDTCNFSSTLNKITEVYLQLDNDNNLIETVESLNELRNRLDGTKLKLIDEVLIQILIDNFDKLNDYQNLLESVFESAINSIVRHSRHNYYRKYLNILHDTGKLATSIDVVIDMHRQFPKDTLPLEYICYIYYKQNMMNENSAIDTSIDQFYETLTRLNLDSDIVEIVKAMHLKETDNLIATREILKGILTLIPNLLYGWVILSEINARLYCWEDAENAARQAVNLMKHKVEDDLLYKLEMIVIESISKTNNEQKWETALQMCDDHLEKRRSKRLELIRARIRVLLDDPDVHVELNNLESLSETRVQATILKALHLKEHEQFEVAVNYLESALETSEAWLLSGIIYWKMGKYNSSQMALLSGIKADRYNWECLVYLGHYYREHGNDLERSRRCYQTALQINPSSEEAGTGLSTAYRLLKDHDANIQLLQRLTVKDKGPKWAWMQLGLQYLDQGDALQAIKALQRVIRADPNNNINWEALADVYFVRGAHTSALKSYQRALDLNPKSFYSMIQLANIKLFLGQYSSAKKDFEHILLSKSCYVPALKGLAEACIALAKVNTSQQFLGRAVDNLQQAMDSLALVITSRNDLSCVWKLLGDVCYRAALLPTKYSRLKVPLVLMKSEMTEYTVLTERRDILLLSARCYCCALSLSPQSPLLWHDLASCYLMRLHLDPSIDHKNLASKCLAIAKHAVKLCPSSWLHWNFLGIVCMSPYIKNYALAQHAFVMAIDRELNNSMVWSNLGTLYLHVGNWYKANEAYNQAQRADPAYMNSWIGQALLAEMMSSQEALDLFRHSTQLGYHPQAAVGYAHSVLTVLKNSTIERDSLHKYIIENMHAVVVASDVMNWYVEQHPDDCYARNAYGLLLERQKLRRSVAEQFAAALPLCTDEEKNLVCINLARVLMQLDNPVKAVKLCRSVKRISYNSQCHLALALFKAGEYEESYNAYETALNLHENTDIEKAYTLCAMAAITYIFQGVHDTKTLLFQCIQIQPPVITGFLAAASLGILHVDVNLAVLVMNELKPYADHPTHGPHVANLSAYSHLISNNIKSAIATLSKAIFKHPDDARYWIHLLRIISQIDLATFNRCAQKALFLSRNTVNTDVMQLACVSFFKYFAQSSTPASIKFIQKLLFAYPGNIENLITYVTPFLQMSKELKHSEITV
ncbi:tetratricopeptide repeat protein 37 [Colletes gigas]|uniref:tetratricopeptide repeat protein 37 n=1 Tax=Colletes gigas TaxID=935657 RepID=UPI001C9A4083|nr:tetratricopeptide repeat protein 37 [Colletes gigas]